MINSLSTSLWLMALACALLLLLRRPVLSYLGARVQYSLWLFVPLAAVLPWLPSLPVTAGIAQQFTVTPELIQNAETYAAANRFLWVWLWAAGTFALIAWMVATSWLFYRRLGQGQSIQLHDAYALQACHLSHIKSPAICGLIRPRLLLPSDFNERYSERQQTLIIAHERLHWQRGDLHYNLFAYLLLALNWFNPLAWMAYRSFRQDQELACDAAILAKYPNDVKTYAEALLTSSLAFQHEQKAALQFGTPHLNHYGAHPMKQRIQQLTIQRGFSRWPLLALIATGFAAWVFVLNPAGATQLMTTSAENIERPTPTPIVRVNPRYPEAAVEQGLEDVVLLRFDITSEGTTDNIWVEVSTSDPIFHDAASDALKRWRFDPRHQGRDYRVAIAFEIP